MSLEPLRQAIEVLPNRHTVEIPQVELDTIASEYRQLFSHNLTPDCSPYETHYGSTHIFWQSRELADLAGFYRAFGLHVSEEAHERVDHISVELEFMGYLALKEAYALDRHHDEQMAIVQDAQRKFLNDHLARWIKAFQERISAKLPGSAYAHLAKVLVRFVQWECHWLDIQPEQVRVGEVPGHGVMEEGCSPCLGQGDSGCA